jgi:hypothetical protein
MKGIFAAVSGQTQFWQAQEADLLLARLFHRGQNSPFVSLPIQGRLVQDRGADFNKFHNPGTTSPQAHLKKLRSRRPDDARSPSLDKAQKYVEIRFFGGDEMRETKCRSGITKFAAEVKMACRASNEQIASIVMTSPIWHTDTNAAFDLVLIGSGTGSNDTWTFGQPANWGSPSGLWLVCADDTATWSILQQAWTAVSFAGAVYQGAATPPVPPPFLAYPPGNSPVNFIGAPPATFIEPKTLWYARNAANNGAWAGNMTYRVFMADPADPSTWQWVSHYWANQSAPAAPTGLHPVNPKP